MKAHSLFTDSFKRLVSTAAAVAMIAGCTGQVCAAEESQEELLKSYADDIVVLVNEAREEHGLAPVYAVPVLHEVAAVRAKESVEIYDHFRPDGRYFNTAFDDFGIVYSAVAENIASGGITPEETFDQWRNSPLHWNNILNASYTHIGVAVYCDENSEFGWYWAQAFATPVDGEMEGQYLPDRNEVTPVCCGDIDGDGVITSFDFLLLEKALKKNIVLNELQLKSADCMLDGSLTIADAIVLKKYLFNVYQTLPVEP